MKFEVYKRTKKNYMPIFEKERETQEISIYIDDMTIHITEHQYGEKLNEPYVDVYIDGVLHSMNLRRFVKNGVR